MRLKGLLALTLGLAAGCDDQRNQLQNSVGEGGNNTGGASVSGIVYGFTAAPDSQRVALAGATVTLVRVGDLVPPGPDTTDSPPPPPPDPDTTLMTRSGFRSLVDSVIPPDTTTPPPPHECGLGVTVATVVTGADGTWQAGDVEEGFYNVRVDPPAGTPWRSIEYCGYVITGEPEPLTLYLPAGPGPDPVP